MGNSKRASGILLHVTSLPSAFGIGDLGPESYRFVDLLADNQQHLWSILPLSPTRLQDGNSPYQTSSAFAGNPLLINPETLFQDGYLTKKPTEKPTKPSNRVNFEEVYKQKKALIEEAYAGFRRVSSFEDFCVQNDWWLTDYALYCALRDTSGKPWSLWPTSVRRRDPRAIVRKVEALGSEVEREKFAQYLFFSQWRALKDHCHKRQVSVVGDMPFYVAYDSTDVWVHPELFELNTCGQPRFVGGVPPDYFSQTGQLWGNPIYNWKKMAETGFDWWIDRIRHNLTLYDTLRLDHFRGFIAYWQVPAKAKTAQAGRWVKTPSTAFFEETQKAFPSLPFIAEDLGYIDEPVRQAIARLGVPGMRVMLFGFDGSEGNPHLPKNHTECSVVYTGTHDTNTAKGWFSGEASAKEKRNVYKAIGKQVSAGTVGFELVKLALASKSRWCVVPLQDVLGLGSNARMNNPSRPCGNWTWRVTGRQLANCKIAVFGDLASRNRRT